MKQRKEDSPNQQIEKELATIDSLLRSESFAVEIAEAQNRAYYVGVGETPKPLLVLGDDTASVTIRKRDEKIATNVAGFYALECGLGAVCAKTNQKPTDFLQMIVDNKADSATVLLLNRFANTTWKAGQPFRGLERIKRPIFKIASLLPEDEVKKDYDQIQAAAIKLLAAMQPVRESSADEQMRKLRSLLQDKQFAATIAAYQDSTCYTAQHKPAPPFLTPEEENATVKKSVKEQKIATNVAGFYELEGGLSYLVTTQQKRPSTILKAIVADTISKQDRELLCRFANAGWKAGQPFRGLDRITRATFTPFYFLSEADIDKDWVQVKAAAGELLKKL
ncbi:hypothetical protein [Spirosoma validum]|uniref:Uncharacterized protein n=1 Tax=Spirosoma validum TaxID=2771355 RepID=A0A927B3Y6_9BACT|nr:hypothetical protein [Spirosoma validum]MBD2754948.1 hypothetical protein [Spirosoma validum]